MIGKTISHYRILEELGSGGMGVVYRAEDTKLKRPVALKFLSPELTRDKEAKTRFVHEAQAASALQHNNICTIHEIDETPDSRIFIAMDCYDGETLKERIANGPIPVAEAVDIAIQIASGLSKAHGAGMVHRDIKPANIMVTREGVVKILDFGLAKLAGQTKLTRTGSTIGTVAYMSPEQAKGAEVDVRSDIFSLGAVLYEMLSGKEPFPGEHEAAVLYGIMNCAPAPLDAQITNFQRDIQRIVDKALQKDPDKRYQSAEDLRHDLATLSQREYLRTDISRRALAQSRRWPVVAALVGSVIIAAFIWMVFPFASDHAKTSDLALAIIDFRDLVTPNDSTISAAITSLVHVGLVEGSPIRIVSPSYIYDLRRRLFGGGGGAIGADQALELARKSGARFALSGQLNEIAGGQCLMWDLVNTKDGRSLAARRAEGGDLVQIAEKAIADILPILGRESGDQSVRLPSVAQISTSSKDAYRRYTEGVLAREIDMFEALKHFEAAVVLDSTFALAYLELSRAYLSVHGVMEEAPARAYADKAWQLRSRLGIKDRMRLEVQRALLEDRVSDVLTTYQEMLERWPDDREALAGLAEHMFWWWYGEEGVQIAERGLALYPDDPHLGEMHVALLLQAGCLNEALEAARNNVQRHPESPMAHIWLGDSYLRLGRSSSAEESYRRAFPLGMFANDTLQCLAFCAYSRGDLKGAAKLYERILSKENMPAGMRITYLSSYTKYIGAAEVFAESGRFKEAIDAFEKEWPNLSDDRRVATIFEYGYNRLLIRMGRSREVLSWAEGLERVSSGYSRQVSWYTATAFVALDSLDRARSALINLELMDKEGYRKARHLIPHVTAQIDLAEARPDEALAVLPEMGRNGAYWETWTFIQWKETVARAYLMAGRLDEAADTYRELLGVCGGHAVSHYELGRIYEDMKRLADAKKEYAKFLEMWSDADEGLPQLVDARKRLAAL